MYFLSDGIFHGHNFLWRWSWQYCSLIVCSVDENEPQKQQCLSGQRKDADAGSVSAPRTEERHCLWDKICSALRCDWFTPRSRFCRSLFLSLQNQSTRHPLCYVIWCRWRTWKINDKILHGTLSLELRLLGYQLEIHQSMDVTSRRWSKLIISYGQIPHIIWGTHTYINRIYSWYGSLKKG